MVGISLPLTGQFSADGIATEHGYQLWASDVNANGGLLGRPVQLKIMNDNSNQNTVTKDYTTLITQDHVDLTLAPFSTLLTSSAAAGRAEVPLRAGRRVGHRRPGLRMKPDPYFFSVSVPDAIEMAPFAKWVLVAAARQAAHHGGLPDGERPVR